MRVLVVDVGGTHLKLVVSGGAAARQLSSHPELTAQELVDRVTDAVADWEYDAVSLGYPGAVGADGPSAEPGNLGRGWVGFDYERAFGVPVRIVNDAAMQALGGYDGGRMLFLGLGTGLGSTLVTERVIVPLELGCLKSPDGNTLFDRLGRDALERNGYDAWMRTIAETIPMLRDSFLADYIVLGGGNANRVDPLPPHTRRGGNDAAFAGGFRLWEDIVEPHDRRSTPVWRVVR